MNFEKKKDKGANDSCTDCVRERIAYALISEEDFRASRIYSPEEAIEELKKRLKV